MSKSPANSISEVNQVMLNHTTKQILGQQADFLRGLEDFCSYVKNPGRPGSSTLMLPEIQAMRKEEKLSNNPKNAALAITDYDVTIPFVPFDFAAMFKKKGLVENAVAGQDYTAGSTGMTSVIYRSRSKYATAIKEYWVKTFLNDIRSIQGAFPIFNRWTESGFVLGDKIFQAYDSLFKRINGNLNRLFEEYVQRMIDNRYLPADFKIDFAPGKNSEVQRTDFRNAFELMTSDMMDVARSSSEESVVMLWIETSIAKSFVLDAGQLLNYAIRNIVSNSISQDINKITLLLQEASLSGYDTVQKLNSIIPTIEANVNRFNYDSKYNYGNVQIGNKTVKQVIFANGSTDITDISLGLQTFTFNTLRKMVKTSRYMLTQQLPTFSNYDLMCLLPQTGYIQLMEDLRDSWVIPGLGTGNTSPYPYAMTGANMLDFINSTMNEALNGTLGLTVFNSFQYGGVKCKLAVVPDAMWNDCMLVDGTDNFDLRSTRNFKFQSLSDDFNTAYNTANPNAQLGTENGQKILLARILVGWNHACAVQRKFEMTHKFIPYHRQFVHADMESFISLGSLKTQFSTLGEVVCEFAGSEDYNTASAEVVANSLYSM
jgi:hypothetical protein